jgi:uncharacterized membrane protein
MRWLHIISAVFAVGGVLFYYCIYRAASNKALPDELKETMWAALMKRWKPFLHSTIIIFLITGFYTYLMVTRTVHDQSLYHALFGVKFLLAIVVFALFIILTSTMKWSEKLRHKHGMWLLLVVLAIAVLLIGGMMRVMPTTPAELIG